MGAESCSFEAVVGVPRDFLAAGSVRQDHAAAHGAPCDPRQGELGRFDISSDGKHIIFDRSSDNSDIVLIDLPQRQ